MFELKTEFSKEKKEKSHRWMAAPRDSHQLPALGAFSSQLLPQLFPASALGYSPLSHVAAAASKAQAPLSHI